MLFTGVSNTKPWNCNWWVWARTLLWTFYAPGLRKLMMIFHFNPPHHPTIVTPSIACSCRDIVYRALVRVPVTLYSCIWWWNPPPPDAFTYSCRRGFKKDISSFVLDAYSYRKMAYSPNFHDASLTCFFFWIAAAADTKAQTKGGKTTKGGKGAGKGPTPNEPEVSNDLMQHFYRLALTLDTHLTPIFY